MSIDLKTILAPTNGQHGLGKPTIKSVSDPAPTNPKTTSETTETPATESGETTVVETDGGKTDKADPKKDQKTNTVTKYGDEKNNAKLIAKATDSTTTPDKTKTPISIGDIAGSLDWNKSGAKPPTTTEQESATTQTTNQAITGFGKFGEVPGSNRPDLAYDGVSPHVLANNEDTINQQYNLASAQDFASQQQSQAIPGYSPYGQGGGNGQQGGLQINNINQAQANAGAVGGAGSYNGGNVSQQVSELPPETPPAKPEPPADEDSDELPETFRY